MARKRYSIFSTTFDKRGRAIASGENDYSRSHPLMKYFSELSGESSEKIWMHSELQAVLRSKSKEVYSILVQRYDALGKPKMAKPCRTCMKMLNAFGVKVIRFTTEDGIMQYEN